MGYALAKESILFSCLGSIGFRVWDLECRVGQVVPRCVVSHWPFVR